MSVADFSKEVNGKKSFNSGEAYKRSHVQHGGPAVVVHFPSANNANNKAYKPTNKNKFERVFTVTLHSWEGEVQNHEMEGGEDHEEGAWQLGD